MRVLLFLLFLVSCEKKEESTFSNNPKSRQIFSSSGSTDESIMAQPHLKGVLVRVFWKDLETSPGVYNWSLIDNQLVLAKRFNKEWSLAVLAGSFSPYWLYSNPFNAPYMNLTFRSNPVKVPLIQSNPLQQRLKSLINALAARYRDDPLLKLIYSPQMTLNGIEGHFNGIGDSTLISQNFSIQDWISYSLEDLRYLASAFPNKKVAIELHEIMGSSMVARSIADSILDGEKKQIGLAIWWLSGKTDYQNDLLDLFKNFTKSNGSVYAQLIDESANAQSFYLNDFGSSFSQAKELGINYIEVWNQDIIKVELFDLFNDFNL